MKKSRTLIFLFLSLLLIGCSKKEEPKNLIYYKETNIPLPQGITRLHDITESSNGNLRILLDTQNENGLIYEQAKDTNQWTLQNESATELNDSLSFDSRFLDSETFYSSVLYNALLAKDGKEAENLPTRYFKIQPDNSIRDLNLDLSPGNQLTEDNFFHLTCSDEKRICGYDNANIIYSFTHSGELLYHTGDLHHTNEETDRLLKHSNIMELLSVENTLYAILNDDEQTVVCFDLESGKIIQGNEKTMKFIRYTDGDAKLYYNQHSKKIYKISNDSLSCFDIETETDEKLFDFLPYDLRNGTYFQIFTDSNGELYIAYSLANKELKLNHYEYVKEGIAAKEKPLKIYSLTENYDLETIISAFQISNPDIPVELEYGYTMDNGITEEDAIRNLNTELLSGNAPDLLVMDGLDVGKYYEKGLLKDLNTIVDLKSEKEKLFTNMLTPYQDENVQYAIPLGFNFYGVVGDSDIVNSIDNGEEFLKTLENKHLDFAIHSLRRSTVANIFYIQHIADCFNTNGEPIPEKLTIFYKDLERIAKLSGNSFPKNEDEKDRTEEKDTTENIQLFYPSSPDHLGTAAEDFYLGALPFALSSYGSPEDFFILKYLVKEKDYNQRFITSDKGLIYNSRNILAASVSTNNNSAIQKFIKFSLNVGQDTMIKNNLCLPINKKILKDNLVMKDASSKPFTISEFGYGENPEMHEIKGLYLTDSEYQKLEKELGSTILFQYNDTFTKETILNEANEYCLGKITLDEAVQNTIQKTSIRNKE